MLDGLARFLAGNTDLSLGRTYAGGLTKFEPRELERVRVPAAEHLAALAR
jgi:adenine-specific DNA-methyltransferase